MQGLDHIVIAAESLTQGVDFVQHTLGVEVPPGGEHRTLGTHNCLMRLGNDSYLEVIAINPQGEVPKRPRWFGLDSSLLRAQLARRPRLLTWVINTPDIEKLAGEAGFDIGTPTALSRDNLSWEIALTDDGRLLADGLLPYCIQWHSSPHPSRGMADLGCRLQNLTLHHNRPEWLAGRLAALGALELVTIDPLPDNEAPYLSATLDTPGGSMTLR